MIDLQPASGPVDSVGFNDPTYMSTSVLNTLELYSALVPLLALVLMRVSVTKTSDCVDVTVRFSPFKLDFSLGFSSSIFNNQKSRRPLILVFEFSCSTSNLLVVLLPTPN